MMPFFVHDAKARILCKLQYKTRVLVGELWLNLVFGDIMLGILPSSEGKILNIILLTAKATAVAIA